jgi:uncharacterized protein (TIGR02172 family)
MHQELGQPIAYGRTAEIYAWRGRQVLKLFYEWFPLERVETEARVGRAIHDIGMPVPAVGAIVRVNARYGLEYERVYGESMFKMFQRKPWNLWRYARRWAELQAAIHDMPGHKDLPLQRQVLANDIRRAAALPVRLREKALAALEEMKDSCQLCHGDFWPGNILMTAQGEIIIDWIHASRGNPLADLARTTNLVLGFTRTGQIKRPFLSYGPSRTGSAKDALMQFLGRIFYPVFLSHYFRLRPSDRKEYRRWLPIVAAARLADNIPELENILISQVDRSL